MKRRFLLILLAACLGLTACQSQTQPGNTAPETTKPAPPETEPAPAMPEIPEGTGLGLDELDAQLIAWSSRASPFPPCL